MQNYIKSEAFRITHSRGMYLLTAGVSAVIFCLHLLLFWLGKSSGGTYPYATARFSLGMLVSSPMLYCYMAFLSAGIMFGEDRKNATVKQAVVCGVTGTGIFAGKCIVGTAAAACSLITIMTVYVGSAWLLLPVDTMEIHAILLQIPAMSLIAMAAMMLGILVLDGFDKNVTGIAVWFLTVTILPRVLLCLARGLQSELLCRAALLLPGNFLTQEVRVTLSGYELLWNTPQGMAKCLLTGAAGLLVVAAAGIYTYENKEF